MTVEVAPFIGNLVITYPEATADYSECDDHLRLIKAAVKASFPIVTGAVTVTEVQFNLLADNIETVGAKLTQFSLSVANHNTRLASIEADHTRFSNTVSAVQARLAVVESYFRGVSQTVVTTARTQSVTYTNSTGYMMWVGLSVYLNNSSGYARAYVDGTLIGQTGPLAASNFAYEEGRMIEFMVPPGSTYYVHRPNAQFVVWTERT